MNPLSSDHNINNTSTTLSTISDHQQFTVTDWEALFEPQFSFTATRLKTKKRRRPLSPTQSPTLPKLDHIRIHNIAQSRPKDQIEVLPRPVASADGPSDEAARKRWKERMEMLQTIREEGLLDELDTVRFPRQQERWQSRIRKKAAQIKRDVQQDDDDSSNQEFGNDNDEKDSTDGSRIHYRASFLFFALGFVFPPMWIIGSLYVPPKSRPSYSHRVDVKWKRRSRYAFLIFIISLSIIFILELAFNPAFIGWRHSNRQESEENPVIDPQ